MSRLTLAQAVGLASLGPAAASILWLLGLFLLPPDDTLDRLAERLRAASPPVISKIAEAPASISALLSRPLFDASGQAIPPTSSLHLQGLVLNGARTAALIASGEKSALWFTLGETHDGVTLRRVAPDRAVVDTFAGEQTLVLGANPLAAPNELAPLNPHP